MKFVDPVPAVCQPGKTIGPGWHRHSILESTFCQRKTVNLSLGDNQPVKVHALLHSKQNRHCICFRPLFVLINPFAKSCVPVFHKLQNAILVIKRENDNIFVIFSGGNFVFPAGLCADSSGRHIFNGCIPNRHRLLRQFSINPLFSKAQIIIEISGKFYKVAMIVTTGPEAFEQSCFQVD